MRRLPYHKCSKESSAKTSPKIAWLLHLFSGTNHALLIMFTGGSTLGFLITGAHFMDYISPTFMILFFIISVLVFAVLLGNEEYHEPKDRLCVFLAGSTYLAIVLFLLRMVAHEIK